VLPPDFSDYIEDFDYSELLRMSTTRASDSSSFENGAAIENIHMMVGISREYSLRRKGKSSYYADASSEASRESDYYATSKVFWVKTLNNNFIDGEML
jgi:hypothetical protein